MLSTSRPRHHSIESDNDASIGWVAKQLKAPVLNFYLARLGQLGHVGPSGQPSYAGSIAHKVAQWMTI